MSVTAQHNGVIREQEHDAWISHTRVVLSPVAAPSILGLFGFAAATFIVAANLAGWYGDAGSGQFLFPFAAAFGGIAQFAAGMWAFRARDGLATAMHGMWGSFWIAYGILQLLAATGALALPEGQFTALGYWFLPLALITALGAVAALRANIALALTLTVLAVGAAFLAVANLTGVGAWETAGGWVLIGAAILAIYVGGAMMIAGSWGRTVLPLGEYSKAANVPGGRPIDALQYESGEPGIKRGQ